MGGSFAGYRRRLFINGGSDQYSLAYILLTLVPAVRRRKFSLQAVSEQLRAEYGREWVDQTLESIDWTTMLWKSHLTGKQFPWGKIPNCKEDLFIVMPLLKELGRYPLYLGRMTNEMIRKAAREAKADGKGSVNDIGNGRGGLADEAKDVQGSLGDLSIDDVD